MATRKSPDNDQAFALLQFQLQQAQAQAAAAASAPTIDKQKFSVDGALMKGILAFTIITTGVSVYKYSKFESDIDLLKSKMEKVEPLSAKVPPLETKVDAMAIKLDQVLSDLGFVRQQITLLTNSSRQGGR